MGRFLERVGLLFRLQLKHHPSPTRQVKRFAVDNLLAGTQALGDANLSINELDTSNIGYFGLILATSHFCIDIYKSFK